jgi:hypothetical protein
VVVVVGVPPKLKPPNVDVAGAVVFAGLLSEKAPVAPPSGVNGDAGGLPNDPTDIGCVVDC